MIKATEIIEKVAKETDRVILFHSASGKDSIALLNLISPKFKEVECAYMYVVKDLQHINRYISYAVNKYPNIRFVQIPHFALASYRKNGYMGCARNKKQKQLTMAKLTDIVRERYNIEWAFFGFKQSDSLNRRTMLRTYGDEAINWKSKKCYPLSSYKNKDVLAYIDRENIIKPERYGNAQSAGTNISDMDYLLWLRDNFPQDLQKVLKEFPLVERLIFEYDNKDE